MTRKKEGLDLMTEDNVLHMIGGVVIGGLFWACGLPAWQSFLFALGFGFGRELWQHWDRTPWMNLHNVGEAMSWGSGAGLVVLVRLFI